MTGTEQKLIDELKAIVYTKQAIIHKKHFDKNGKHLTDNINQITLEVLIDTCENTFVSLTRNGASFHCIGREEINFTEQNGYGITAFEAVARMFLAVQDVYQNQNKK